MSKDAGSPPPVPPLADAILQFASEHQGRVSVEWGVPASGEELQRIEASLGFSLPPAYRDFIRLRGAARVTTALEDGGEALTLFGHGPGLTLGEVETHGIDPKLGVCALVNERVNSVGVFALARDGMFYAVREGAPHGRGTPEFDRFGTFLTRMGRELSEPRADALLRELRREWGDSVRVEGPGPMSAAEVANGEATADFRIPPAYARFLRIVGPLLLRSSSSGFPNELRVRAPGPHGDFSSMPSQAAHRDDPDDHEEVLPVLETRFSGREHAAVTALDRAGHFVGLEEERIDFGLMTARRGFDWQLIRELRRFSEAACIPDVVNFLQQALESLREPRPGHPPVTIRHGAPASEDQLRAIETASGSPLPDDYRHFLKRFGALQLGCILIPGVGDRDLNALECFSEERARLESTGLNLRGAILCLAREGAPETFSVLQGSEVRTVANQRLDDRSASSQTFTQAVFREVSSLLSTPD